MINFETFFDNCQSSVPRYARRYMRNRSIALTQAVGVGKHTREEVAEMMLNDLRQFSEILGTFMDPFTERLS